MPEPEPETLDIPTNLIAKVLKKYLASIVAALVGIIATGAVGVGTGAFAAYAEVQKIPAIEAELTALKVQQQQLAFNAWVACAMLTQLHPEEKAQVEHGFALKLDCNSPLGVKPAP